MGFAKESCEDLTNNFDTIKYQMDSLLNPSNTVENFLKDRLVRKSLEMAVLVEKELEVSVATPSHDDVPERDYNVRNSAWTLLFPPDKLANGPIEIMGPARLDVVKAGLASGANVFVADLADISDLPWDEYVCTLWQLAELSASTAHDGGSHTTLMVRPRTLAERDVRFNKGNVRSLTAGILDLALFTTFHVHFRTGIDGPLFYLPDVPSRAIASNWDMVIGHVEAELDLQSPSIRTSAEIRQPSGVMQAEEILWEHRRHSVGLGIRYVDDPVGIGSAGMVELEGGQVSRSDLRDAINMCDRRGGRAICGVRNGVPLKAGRGIVKVTLARAVPPSRAKAG